MNYCYVMLCYVMPCFCIPCFRGILVNHGRLVLYSYTRYSTHTHSRVIFFFISSCLYSPKFDESFSKIFHKICMHL